MNQDAARLTKEDMSELWQQALTLLRAELERRAKLLELANPPALAAVRRILRQWQIQEPPKDADGALA
jgi:hypothetical protein